MVIDSPHQFVSFSAPGYSYTAPVWMGEFGQMVRGNYWLNMLSSLVRRQRWCQGDFSQSATHLVQDTPISRKMVYES